MPVDCSGRFVKEDKKDRERAKADERTAKEAARGAKAAAKAKPKAGAKGKAHAATSSSSSASALTEDEFEDLEDPHPFVDDMPMPRSKALVSDPDAPAGASGETMGAPTVSGTAALKALLQSE